ncbi:hypothetical protein YQE_04710, partial [Dendroctonus ponderosae]
MFEIVWLVVCCLIHLSNGDCVPSETIASGHLAKDANSICAGDVVFEENFDQFDLEKWEHEITLSGGGNWEFQYYTNNRSNSYVENGNLHIRPTFVSDDYGENFLNSGTLDLNGAMPVDQCTDSSYYGCVRAGTGINYLNPIKSAKIKTCSSFSFRYGKIVTRAKMPSGDWLWPAIWMLPRFNSYGRWPASGEIDIVESRGNKNLFNPQSVNIGTQEAASTLHWGPFNQVNQWAKTHYSKSNSAGYDTDFHEYEVQWSSTNFTFYIDGELIGTTNPPAEGFWELGGFEDSTFDNPWKGTTQMAPFDQKFYLIINLAVGGTNSFFGDENENPGGKPWKNTSPTAYRDFWKGKDQWLPTWNMDNDDTHLIVDYIKVFAI